MIDFKVTTIGGEEITRQFERGPGAVRAVIRDELAQIGDEIVSRARSLAPKKTGIMASKILWYFGREATASQRRKQGLNRFGSLDADMGPIYFTARPTGSVAHLIERGPKTGQRKAHQRRLPTTATTVWTRRGQRRLFSREGRATFRRPTTFVKGHEFRWTARPFFMPAVASVGGDAGVATRLQEALAKAPAVMRGAA
jgi:hypothetical protein